jgi:5-(carboxyamino)imidazole ribonucleotide synthase
MADLAYPRLPESAALAVAQDRLLEKALFAEIGLDTPTYAAVDSIDGLRAAVATTGLPAVLKTRRLGYDGKGQYVIRQNADIEPAWASLGGVPLILEAFVAFEREVSVIAVRSRNGEFRHYPLTRNWHRDGILSVSLAPLPGDPDLEARAVDRARGEPHYVGDRWNCSSWMDRWATRWRRVCTIRSLDDRRRGVQPFENHVRAVLGLPLGDTRANGYSAMLNWIGELPDAKPVLAESRGHWHDYGKSSRAGRKVGHATVCADSPTELADRLRRIGLALGREAQVRPAVEVLTS